LVETKLQDIRRRLLDLTRRNRLLNHQAKGESTLQIVDEIPAQVYGVLVDDARTMQFLSREEAPKPLREPLTNEAPPPSRGDALSLLPPPVRRGRVGEGAGEALVGTGIQSQKEPPPYPPPAYRGREEGPPPNLSRTPLSPSPAVRPTHDLPLAPVSATSPSDRHQDRNLQTLLTGEKLQTRLVHLAREAASALQEQGYNILYMTLGIVEWREVEDQAVTSRAPLVFIPVEFKRKTVNTRYSVQLFEDDVLTNPCLAELCQNQFGFELPIFDLSLIHI